MKNIKNKLVILLSVIFALPCFVVAQEDLTTELEYEVGKIFPPLSMSKEKLLAAETLMDLNRVYESSWIREFIAVEISAMNNGKLIKVVHKNDTMSEEQKAIMRQADEGTEISVKVRYIPENTLKHNDPKEYNFSFLVNPDKEATYVGGEKELKKYLKKSVIDKIPDGLLEGYAFAAVKFTVSEEGEILNPHLSWPTKDENVDKLLLETVRKMPCWKPAEYASGLKVKQDFAFMVGNMESCVVNVLNVRQLEREKN